MKVIQLKIRSDFQPLQSNNQKMLKTPKNIFSKLGIKRTEEFQLRAATVKKVITMK